MRISSFRIHPMFTDHMILQREKPVPVWGTGEEGDRVVVELDGCREETMIHNGKWRVMLPSMQAGGPFQLTVKTKNQEMVINDVLVGDVWLAGGQSNMEWVLVDTTGAHEHIASANHPNIRYYHVPKAAYDDGEEHTSAWEICTPVNAPHFSAVAYHFARNVHRSLDVPVGIINCNWGGTSAACWVAQSRLENEPKLQIYLDEYAEQLKGFSWEAFEAEQKHYDDAVAEYNRKAAEGKTGGELGDFPWPPPFSPRSFMRPNGLYETMLRKASPYALKGFIYYQGESDAHRAFLYDTLLEQLIRNWREDWEDDELPFLFVQLPAWGCDGNPDGDDWPRLRESQKLVTERVPNTGMAVALDCGELNDIHPKDKQPVGERLALVALERVYGLNVESSGPVFRSMQTQGDKVIVNFDHAGDGLKAAAKMAQNSNLIGFEAAGEDGVYYQAQAVIRDSDSVEVWSGNVPSPAAVRYGWANYTEANLANSQGLPAEPFRTHRTSR